MACIDDKLREVAENIGSNNNLIRVGRAGSFFKNSLKCLASFLTFLAANPATIAQFRTFLFGLKALAEAQVAAIDLVVAQLERINGTAKSLIDQVKGSVAQARASLAPYPFEAFNNCPAVDFIKERTLRLLPKIPGISKFKNKIPGLAWIKRKQQEVKARENYIERLKNFVEDIKVWVQVWDGIIDSIDSCFT